MPVLSSSASVPLSLDVRGHCRWGGVVVRWPFSVSRGSGARAPRRLYGCGDRVNWRRFSGVERSDSTGVLLGEDPCCSSEASEEAMTPWMIMLYGLMIDRRTSYRR